MRELVCRLPLLQAGRYGQCLGGGGLDLSGHLIDGLQAEYARVPFSTTLCTRSR